VIHQNNNIVKDVLLWLDDYRDPKDTEFLTKFCPEFEAHRKGVIWVKNYNEFKNWIETNGLPDKISFDHDLADEHYTPVERYGDYNKWSSEMNSKEKTGMDCAKYLVDYCLDNDVTLPKWTVHSANPEGAKNITKYLINFMRQ